MSGDLRFAIARACGRLVLALAAGIGAFCLLASTGCGGAVAAEDGEFYGLRLHRESEAAVVVVTHESERSLPENAIAIEVTGTITPPLADELRQVWRGYRDKPGIDTIIVNLDSRGGVVSEGMLIIALLEAIRESGKTLVTVVENGHTCGSMCLPIYVQGDRRIAFPASAWMLHGSCPSYTNVPDPTVTCAIFAILRARGIEGPLIDEFFVRGYDRVPGEYWLSGSELHQRANIITDLRPNWRGMQPSFRLPFKTPQR